MSPVDALVEAVALKRVRRAGWVRAGVPDPESVASHAWGVSWLVLALCPAALDRGRALAYAVIHDLAEVRVGDLTPLDRISKVEKARRERRALGQMVAPLASAPELTALFEAYEAQADDEARFVRECDRLDMALQALADGDGRDLSEFVRSAGEVISHPTLRAVFDEVARRLPVAPG